MDGERSYRLARRGRGVDPADIAVTVYDAELVRFAAPDVTFRVAVSPGTYVRALARDLGQRLGVGAHLIALRREAIGGLRVADAVPVERLTPDALLPVRTVLQHLPAVELDEPARVAVSHGRPVPAADGPEGHVALLARGRGGRGGRGRRRLASAGRGAGSAVSSGIPPLPRGSTVTVGSFDGVHLGHQAVLREIARRAEAAGRVSVLVTFEPHPLEVVNPQAAPPLLTTDPERREMLAQLPLDYVLLVRFDRRLASLSPEEFVDQVLLDRCQMRELVIGHDHGFGRGRSGDVETLRRLGALRGFDVDVVEAVDVGEQHVSSSRIRRAIAGGDLAHRRPDAGPPVPGERSGGPGRAARPPDRRADDQPGGHPASEAAAARRGVRRPGRVARRAGGGMMNQGPKPTFQDGRRSARGASVRLRWRSLRRVGADRMGRAPA